MTIKILSDKEHVIKRPAMYIGSTTSEPHERFVFGEYKQIEYVPGLIKIISEVIDNSIDEAIRTNFEYANKISVNIDATSVTVTDNGRGIPQADVKTPESDIIPGPVAAWTRTKAGSNFGDDSTRKTIGMNGVGSSLTNIFSKEFTGVTCDGKTTITVVCSDNMDQVDFKKKRGGTQGTSVTFKPDFSHFDCELITENVIDLVKDQLQTLAVIYPQITFKFNNERLQSSFKKYAALYSSSSIVVETTTCSIALSTSPDGFRHLTYVNGVHTKNGGTHVEYIMDELSNELMPAIKRKYKIEINKARIKECLTMLMFIRNMSNMRFDSQTKERLTSPYGEIKSHIDVDVKKLAKLLLNNEEVLTPIIEAALARKLAAEKAAQTKAQKAAQKAKVSKHIKANRYGDDKLETTLFLTEGDCFDENEMIYTVDGNVSGKDIQVGDTVMTRSHNFKKVTAKTIRLKAGFLVNGKILSADHKLYAYDIITGVVDYIKVSDLDKTRHKLIKNRLVSLGGPIDRQRKILDLNPDGMRVRSSAGTEHYVKSSQSHEFLVLTDGGLVLKPFKDLTYEDILVL